MANRLIGKSVRLTSAAGCAAHETESGLCDGRNRASPKPANPQPGRPTRGRSEFSLRAERPRFSSNYVQKDCLEFTRSYVSAYGVYPAAKEIILATGHLQGSVCKALSGLVHRGEVIRHVDIWPNRFSAVDRIARGSAGRINASASVQSEMPRVSPPEAA